jgi:hypothetical protein
MRVRWLLLAAILTQWQCLVASKKALSLLYWAMCAVLYWRTAAAIKRPAKLVHFFIVVLFAVAPAATRTIRSE